jgi:hypothetical protein
VVLSKPTNTADGDTLVAVVMNRTSASGAITPPTGWTQVAINTTNDTYGVYALPVPTASAVTATSWTWTFGGAATRCAGLLFRVTGSNTSSPVDSTGSLAPNTGTTQVVIPTTTAGVPNTLGIAVAVDVDQTLANNSNTSWAFPSPYTKLAQVNSSSDTTNAKVAIAVGTATFAISGATGTVTPTNTPAATNTGGVLFTLAPVSVPVTASSCYAGADKAGSSYTVGAVCPIGPDATVTLFGGQTVIGYEWKQYANGAPTVAVDNANSLTGATFTPTQSADYEFDLFVTLAG